MEANKYQEAALRTASSLKPEDLILNGVLGLAGESGEVVDLVKKTFIPGPRIRQGKASRRTWRRLLVCGHNSQGIRL